MTSAVDRLSRADRRRLLERRMDELRELDRLMRQPGTLAEPDEPVPLHRAGRDTTAERKT